MKVEMTKHDMTRWCQDYEVELLQSAGWVRKNKADDEVIRRKPTVKTKATETALDEANNKGDE